MNATAFRGEPRRRGPALDIAGVGGPGPRRSHGRQRSEPGAGTNDPRRAVRRYADRVIDGYR